VSFSTLLGIVFAIGLIAWILFVIFGQVTVRKLRKNPETKQVLGIEFASGWDIFNVAEALALPKAVAQKSRKHPTMGTLHADPDVLYKHTTVFDRVLARVFCALFYFSGLSMIILIIAYFLFDLG